MVGVLVVGVAFVALGFAATRDVAPAAASTSTLASAVEQAGATDVQVTSTDQGVRVTGRVPSERVRRRALEAARSLSPNEAVVDGLTVESAGDLVPQSLAPGIAPPATEASAPPPAEAAAYPARAATAEPTRGTVVAPPAPETVKPFVAPVVVPASAPKPAPAAKPTPAPESSRTTASRSASSPAVADAPPSADPCDARSAEFDGAMLSFVPDTATLSEQGYQVVARLGQYLKTCPTSIVKVQAYATERSSSPANLALSRQRSQAVAGHLNKLGVAPYRLVTTYRGDAPPGGNGAYLSLFREDGP